jgi:hypothetical protein
MRGTAVLNWHLSHRADKRALPISDRHYNRQKPGTPQFVPPGRCLVLLTEAADAVWVTSWPLPEYVKHAWPGAWINSSFRNESPHLATDLIREAIGVTRWYWPDTPELGMVTFINPKKVRPTLVRGLPTFGKVYRDAGFSYAGTTKDGLLAFQMLPKDMPECVEPMPEHGRLCLS